MLLSGKFGQLGFCLGETVRQKTPLPLGHSQLRSRISQALFVLDMPLLQCLMDLFQLGELPCQLLLCAAAEDQRLLGRVQGALCSRSWSCAQRCSCPPSRASFSNRFWWISRSSPSGKPTSWKIFSRSMCSIMCREFGFSGDWRSHVNQVLLLPALRVSSSSSLFRCCWLSGSIKAR